MDASLLVHFFVNDFSLQYDGDLWTSREPLLVTENKVTSGYDIAMDFRFLNNLRHHDQLEGLLVHPHGRLVFLDHFDKLKLLYWISVVCLVSMSLNWRMLERSRSLAMARRIACR